MCLEEWFRGSRNGSVVLEEQFCRSGETVPCV